MDTKRVVYIIFAFLLTVGASAQTQRGMVKTRGKMVNGVLHPGHGLPGATVTILNGNSYVVRNNNGTFSFPVPANTYSVKNVQKEGYQLVDADAVKKPYHHSANTLYLVMETPEQLMEDQLEAEEKISRTLREQLKKARMELQRQKEANKISENEYRQKINQLMQDQENSRKLIADMAKEYAQLDYDQMDSLNQRISDAILNGRLMEADSLLRSKGDMRGRIADIRREQQVEAQEEAELAQRQENLAVSKTGTLKKLEDAASDCYKFFDRFKLANQHDSATYYIELRAELDTTNAYWQFEAGYYLHKQNQYHKVEHYYLRALKFYRRLSQTNPQAYEPALAMTLNNLAALYNDIRRFTESESMYKESLEIYRRLSQTNPQAYEPDVAMTLNNLALLYSDLQRFTESESMYKEALGIYRRLSQTNPQAYEPALAMTLNNLAALYNDIRRFTESESMYKEALEIRRRLSQTNPQAYEPDVAMTLNNLANLYSDLQRFTESESMYKESLGIYRRLSQTNPQAYEPDVAATLNNLAILYKDTQRFTESESMYKEALEIRRRLSQTNPQAYEPDVAATLHNLADLYLNTNRFSESESMYKESLEIYRRLSQTNPQAYEPDVAMILNNLAFLYKDTQRFTESESMYKEALEIRRRLSQTNPQAYEPALVRTLNNLAALYNGIRRFTEGESMCKEALKLCRRLSQTNPQAYEPDVAATLHNLASLYKNTQRFSESESMFKESLGIRRRLSQTNPQAYEPDVAATLNNLAILYKDTQRFTESESMYKEALEIYRRLSQTNPQTYELDIARTQYNLGFLKVQQKKYSEAISPFEESLEIYRRISKTDSSQQQWHEGSLYFLSALYPTINNYRAAYRINQEWLLIMKKKYLENPVANKSDYVGEVGDQSFYAIFAEQYAEAEQLAREGLAVDSTQHFIYTNLAASLLFQGKYEEAEKIYRQFKSELKGGFLDDFEKYAEAGVIPKEREADVERIKKMLNEK